MKVHHVGYAVKDIEKALAKFQALGYEPISETVDDAVRRVRIVFVKNEYETVELIAPNEEDSVVDSVLKKNGPSPYHICYEVDDLDVAANDLKNQGYIVMIKAQEAPALQSRKVVFLLNKDVGIIEIVESASKHGV